MATQEDVLAQEERLTLATRRIDLDALDAIYADDIMFTGIGGVICDKAAVMDEARRGAAQRADPPGRSVIARYDKEDVRVVLHGDTAVTSFRFVVTIDTDGQSTRRSYRTSNVWMRSGDRWQVIAAHTAALP
jgi:ketosteroid isomerase-like protein